MLINYKYIVHERTEDAPFTGALISSIDCHFNCRGCFNQHLRDTETKTATAEEIIAEVKSNPFNQGIILGGMEWSEQPEEMLALAKTASENGLQVMIYTGHTLDGFQKLIGRYAAQKENTIDEIDMYLLNPSDEGIFVFLGAMILDAIIENGYYLKCGIYDAEDLATDRTMFGVRLASNNQTIYKFLTDVEDKQNGKTEESGNGDGIWNNRRANRAERRKSKGDARHPGGNNRSH